MRLRITSFQLKGSFLYIQYPPYPRPARMARKMRRQRAFCRMEMSFCFMTCCRVEESTLLVIFAQCKEVLKRGIKKGG